METTARGSPGRKPLRHRYSRSLRQWPSLDTITTTPGRSVVSCSCQVIPNRSATIPNCSASVAASVEDSTWTRMKNCRLAGLPYCWESRMLLPRSARKPDTACTIPGRSGHDRVRTSSWPRPHPVMRAAARASGLLDQRDVELEGDLLADQRRRRRPSGDVEATPQSLRLILVLPSKPTRKLPHGSTDCPVFSNSIVTGFVVSLMVRSPVRTKSSSPFASALVLTKVIVGCFSTSKKSAVRTWASRSSFPVSTLAASISIVAVLFATLSSSRWTSPVQFVNWPRTVVDHRVLGGEAESAVGDVEVVVAGECGGGLCHVPCSFDARIGCRDVACISN